MSVLAARSMLVLALLFGLLFGVGTAVLWYMNMPVWIAIVFSVVVVGLQYLIGPYIIDWIYRIGWIQPSAVGPDFARFVEDACRRDGIPVPRFGVIEDGNPNAFTYGHTPGDARLAITRGLIDMLSEEELEAVVGHELGHIKHWDFVVMTIASLIPLILYNLYFFTRYNIGDRKNSSYVLIIAVTAYIAYVVSQYIALFLSRIREYYADHHASELTNRPNALATALVTVAYGLAKAGPPRQEDSEKKKRPALDKMSAISGLSFFGRKGVSQFAMSASDSSGNFSIENMQKAMRWDLHNPWAKWFELNSTHPLPARRIMEMKKRAGEIVHDDSYRYDAAGTSYTGKFIADLFVLLLPYIGLAAGFGLASMSAGGILHFPLSKIGLILLLGGIGWMARTLIVYKADFKQSSIVSLITETDVSHVRPIPSEIRGKVIGRGVPGLFFSDDLVLQDENGFITLIYRQPLGFLEFLFGWLKAGSLIGKSGVIRGWYRRGPTPYFEMMDARFENGQTVRCWYYQFLLAISTITAAAGLVLMFVLR